ncbi:UNVERIFIED_CONTAM: hypothetical protein Scaly_0806800 [Sesamum calycinum]|uniref:Uncharacterized protein n=1 Tax=Sesamum calycinum TaxID=2727403 RepID=A0AAW2R9P4_9LAMI
MVFMESHESRGVDRSSKSRMQVESAAHHHAPLKSNLKKTASTMEMNGKLSSGMRKVSWSDAHGKDIAHVQEFEPSEEEELGGVGNSCRCAIQ